MYNLSASNVTVTDSMLIAVIGILIVFVVLAILIFILIGFSKIMAKLVNEEESEDSSLIIRDEETNNATNSDEVIAAITSAITVFMDNNARETNTDSAPFIIRKIRRI